MKLGTALVALALLPLAGCFGADGEDEGTQLGSATSEGPAGSRGALTNATRGANATSPGDMSGGHAPHIHDYWGDRERVTLFDDVVDLWLLEGGTFGRLFRGKEVALGGVSWELPEGATVYEGTGRIEITASWTDATITGLGVRWKPANVPFDWRGDSFTPMQPLVNGEPFVIEVAPEMTDMPHVAVSRWMFYFGGSGSPSVAEGSFELKVDIVRMHDVMTFPGHPDTYEDTDRYVLADKDFTYRSQSWSSQLASFATSSEPPEPVTLDHGVPMETRALLVEIKVTSSTVAPLARQTGLNLVYRAADGDWDLAVVLNKTAEDTYLFGIPVNDDQVDSPYADLSQWQLHPRLAQRTEAPGFRGFNCGGCFDSEIQGHVVVTAYAEDPTGKLGADRDEDDDRV